MNVVAWVLVATSGLLGVLLVLLSYRRTVPSETMIELQRSGLAMPANSYARTLQFVSATSRVPGYIVLASTAATLLICAALTPALGSLVTISVSAFIFGAAFPASLLVAAQRDSRERLADPTLTPDTRTLSRRDFQSLRLRLVSAIGGVITIVASGLFAISGIQPIGYRDEVSLGESSVGLFSAVVGMVLAGWVFQARLASIPLASSGLAELAWEDALRSMLFRRGFVTAVNPALVLIALISFPNLPEELVPSALVFALLALGFYAIVGIYMLATRRRQPYMLFHLWPEVAATRAAGPTPAQLEVVAP